MDCKLFDEKKMLYLYGELSPQEWDEVRTHIKSCTRCDREFRRLSGILDIVKELPQSSPSERCLGRIRGIARRREQAGVLEKLRGVFTPQNVVLKRVSLGGALAVVTVVVVSFYFVEMRRPELTNLEWEDRAFEQKVVAVEESLKPVSYDFGVTNGFPFNSFDEKLEGLEEEVRELTEEIKGV